MHLQPLALQQGVRLDVASCSRVTLPFRYTIVYCSAGSEDGQPQLVTLRSENEGLRSQLAALQEQHTGQQAAVAHLQQQLSLSARPVRPTRALSVSTLRNYPQIRWLSQASSLLPAMAARCGGVHAGQASKAQALVGRRTCAPA